MENIVSNTENIVIKVLNKEHGKQVIEYFKSQGVDTKGLYGIDVGYYYGVIDGKFTEVKNLNERNEDVEVIKLPKEYNKSFPRIMMVSDYPINEDNPGQRRVVFMYKCEKYLAWTDVETFDKAEKEYYVDNWDYAKDLSEEITITKSDLMEKEAEIRRIFNIDNDHLIKFEL